MNDFQQELSRRLDSIREQGLYRVLRCADSPQVPQLQVEGKSLLSFASNDYLGLANEPALKQAALEAVERYGAGAGASRLICGTLTPHQELEESLAHFKGTEAALSFATGYAAAQGALCAVCGKEDILILDKLVHACIIDAARLSGAKLRVFAHNDLEDLERILQWAAKQPRSTDASSGAARALVVTESIFSMDGDYAPLREIADLKDKYGAWLMVDEAHATGLYGSNRRGLAEEFQVSNRIEIQMGTLGKALGAAGGYIAGSRTLIDYLINRARSFIFSTAPVPASAAAAAAGIRFVQSPEGEQRRQLLWQRVAEVMTGLKLQQPTIPSAIIPLMLGEESAAVRSAAALREQGIFLPAIRYPTVARGQARLRLTVSAAHTSADIAKVVAALHSLALDFRL